MSKHNHVLRTQTLGITGDNKRRFMISYGYTDNIYFIKAYMVGEEEPIIDVTSSTQSIGELISLGMILGLPMNVLEKICKLEDI